MIIGKSRNIFFYGYNGDIWSGPYAIYGIYIFTEII